MFDLSRGVPDLVHLEIGEPDFPTPSHIIEAAKNALDEGHTRYTPNAGDPELLKRISEKLSKDNKIEADPKSQIMVSSGAMQAISSTILVTINPGDEVLIPDPGYESFSRQVIFAGGIPVAVQVKQEDLFRLNPGALEEAMTRKTKMIIINSPSNPTGAMMTRKDLEGVAELAQRRDLLVVADEIYEKLIYDGMEHVSIASLPGMSDRTITVYSFSKTYAMTGWRVGYAVGPTPIMKEMTKIQEFSVSCAAAVCQRAALAALDGPQDCVKEMVSEYARRRDFMYKELTELEQLTCVKPKGAFYLFPDVSGTNMRSEEASEFLLKKGKVVTVPGVAFGKCGDDFIRLSLGNSMENLEIAARRIRGALEN